MLHELILHFFIYLIVILCNWDFQLSEKSDDSSSCPTPHVTLEIDDNITVDMDDYDASQVVPLEKVNTWEKTRLGKRQ